MAVRETTAGARDREHRFFTRMAMLFTLVVLLGFARTYYLLPVLDAPRPPSGRALTPLIHLHSALFTAWLALLVVQARLIAAHRVALHRRVGVAGALLATAMVVVGIQTALHGVLRGVAPGGLEPRRFLAVPLFAILVFAFLFAAALLLRRDPQSHKRLILLATTALLPPALARWVILYLGLVPQLVFALSLLFLVPLVVWDLRSLRRIHPATLWGGLLLVVSGPLRFALARTDGWLRFSDWAVGLVR